MVNVHIPSLFHLLLSWGLVEPFQPRFIYPCEFISASFLSNVVSKWSQYFFYILVQLFVQTVVHLCMVAAVVWKLLLRRIWSFGS